MSDARPSNRPQRSAPAAPIAFTAGGKARRPLGGEQKVVGFISWATIVLFTIGVVAFPGRLTPIVGLAVAYMMLRMIYLVIFSIAGSVRCRNWARRDWSCDAAVADLTMPPRVDPAPPFTAEDLHHIVLVPSFGESVGVLEATLEGIARQEGARERVTVVLAMEQKEAGSAEKGAALAERFAGCFAHCLVTVHPANLPGEIPCKGSNATWAALEAKRYIVDDLGIPLDQVTVTSCDADSILHRHYLSAVGRMFAADPDRHKLFWQAPLLYYNNVWDVPFPVRFMAYFTHALCMGELSNPFTKPLPLSTYSLSLRLLDEAGYWDPRVISEDWHIYLQAYFARRGDVALRRVFLPTTADMPYGETPWKALVAMYHQALRHSWGAEDVGFILRSWPGSGAPAFRTTALLQHVARDHLLRIVPWIVFTSGMALSLMTLTGHNPLPPNYPPLALVVQYLWVSGSLLMLALLGIELWRYPPPELRRLPRSVLEMFVAWLMLPVISFSFGVAPALHAQTKLMLGRGLSWRVTPKRLAARLDES